MKQLLAIIVCFFYSQIVNAQTPAISPSPGSITWCPGEETQFEVTTVGAQQTACLYKWTITNGTIANGEDNKRTVRVTWNDTPSSGTLSVTLTNCSEATNTSATEKYVIRSLSGKTPANARANQLLPYCSTGTIQLAVDVMFMDNTGGTTGVLQQRADGYEWVLPTGWSSAGSTGTIRTSTEFISITPDNGCRGGSVSVRAFKNCTDRKYSAAATISVGRVGFNASLGIPSGYSGPKCGNQTGVTFTAANLSCASSYRWTATNTGWKDGNGALGPWTTATNTLTLFPSGSPTDDGTISVDANIGCATLTQTYRATYTDPPLTKPVFAINNVMLLCSNGTGTASISPIPDASTYSWHGGSNVFINNVTATASNPVITTTPNVTIKAPTFSPTANGSASFITVSASRSNLNCAGSQSVNYKVWVGRPALVQRLMLGHSESPFNLCINSTYMFSAIDPINQRGYTTYYWYKPENSTILSGQGTNTLRLKTGNLISLNSWLSVGAANACGTSDIANAQLTISNCSGGGRNLAISVYPNPASNELNVTLLSEEKIVPDEYRLIIYNDDQRKVSETKLSHTETSISVREYKKGVYYLHVVDQEGNISERIRIMIGMN